jgi:hypothetical protein
MTIGLTAIPPIQRYDRVGIFSIDANQRRRQDFERGLFSPKSLISTVNFNWKIFPGTAHANNVVTDE